MTLPLTVIGGYLGAGKTTLINRVLAGGHGLRLMVMVNDFGAINIDAALLASATEDRMELTNGCVCCTMGADLFLAIGDVLDRDELPDHLLIEASGIANPAKIAQVAQAEPDLCYAGIVTVVDGLHIDGLLADTQIAPQIETQIQVADVLVGTKAALPLDRVNALSSAPLLDSNTDPCDILLSLRGDVPETNDAHAHFVKWDLAQPAEMDAAALREKLARRPPGLYRVKGFVQGPNGMLAVQVVGNSIEVTTSDTSRSALVGIGPEGQVTLDEITTWWSAP